MQGDAGCQTVIEDLVRRVAGESADQLAGLLQSIEPELQDRLRRAANSIPTPADGAATEQAPNSQP